MLAHVRDIGPKQVFDRDGMDNDFTTRLFFAFTGSGMRHERNAIGQWLYDVVATHYGTFREEYQWSISINQGCNRCFQRFAIQAFAVNTESAADFYGKCLQPMLVE